MNAPRHIFRLLAACLAVQLCAQVSGLAQQSPAASISVPPAPPLPKSPVEVFRELLAMNAADREQFLTNRPLEMRRRLEAKLREYETMNPQARDAALGATELHWYLDWFIQLPATNRNAQLAAVPERYRKIVDDRVRVFSILPPPLQKEVLEYQTTSRYFIGEKAAVTNVPPPPMPPVALVELTRISAEERRKMHASFQRFFEMDDGEKQKVLGALSETQRRQVGKLLEALERLPALQRVTGLNSIGRLMSMSAAEQRQFFSNAARWKELPEEERQVWLKLVTRLPPPMPPPFPVRGRLFATNTNAP